MVLLEAPVVMVGTDSGEVERRLRAGELSCPCGGDLAPWGYARERMVRGVGGLRPRRARCGRCLVTHVLLAVSCLVRRADGVEVIGAALRMKASRGGASADRRAAGPGRSRRCAVGCARSRQRRAVRSVFTALLVQLDPLAGPLPSHPCVFADAVEVLGACGAAARRRLGVLGAVSPWQLASAVTHGRLLAPAAPRS